MASWQDSTYQKQISYYKRLAADYSAQEQRRMADLAQYYGTLGQAGTTEPGYKYNRRFKDKKGKWQYTTGNVKKLKGDYWNRTWKGKKVKTPQMTKKKPVAATEGLYQRELKEDRERDVEEILDDYASRGILHSGLYAKKRSDYETEFGKQLAEINRQRSKMYSDLATEKTAFEREQELQKENARLDAIRRRAAKTGALDF